MLSLLLLLAPAAVVSDHHIGHSAINDGYGAPAAIADQYGAPATPYTPQHASSTYGEWVEVPRDERYVAPPPPAPLPAPRATGPLGKIFGSVPWWTWDRQAVSEGIFKNENIMIHVGQNLFNYVFSTLAWMILSIIYTL